MFFARWNYSLGVWESIQMQTLIDWALCVLKRKLKKLLLI